MTPRLWGQNCKCSPLTCNSRWFIEFFLKPSLNPLQHAMFIIQHCRNPTSCTSLAIMLHDTVFRDISSSLCAKETCYFRPRSRVSRCFWIPTFFFRDSAYSFHKYSVNPAYESATFWIHSPDWIFLNTLGIRNRVDAKSGYIVIFFLIQWRHKSSPVLYREYSRRRRANCYCFSWTWVLSLITCVQYNLPMITVHLN